MYFEVLPCAQDALPGLFSGFAQLLLFFKSLNSLVPLLYPVGQWFKPSPCLNDLFCQGRSP